MAQTLKTEAEALPELRAPGPAGPGCCSEVCILEKHRGGGGRVQSRHSVHPALRIPARKIKMDMFERLAAEHVGGVLGGSK